MNREVEAVASGDLEEGVAKAGISRPGNGFAGLEGSSEQPAS